MDFSINALILAGAPNNGKLAASSDKEFEALIDINGKPLLQYVLNGLLESSKVDEIVVVCPVIVSEKFVEEKEYSKVKFVASKDDLIDNFMLGLGSFEQSKMALVLTSDIPFIRGKDIDTFIDQCSEEGVEVFYPLISKDKLESRFPGASRTYFKIREGLFTAGNIFYVEPEIVFSRQGLLKKAFELRKNPAGLVSLLGAGLIFKYLSGKLSIIDIENKVKDSFNIVGKGLITDVTSIGMDIDKPEDLALAKIML